MNERAMSRRVSRRGPFSSARRVAQCVTTVERLEPRSMMAVTPLASPPVQGRNPPVRSCDAVGTNVAHPTWGSVGQQLLRRAAPAYADGVAAPSGADRPSARLVSNLLAGSPSGGLSTTGIGARSSTRGACLSTTTSASPNPPRPVRPSRSPCRRATPGSIRLGRAPRRSRCRGRPTIRQRAPPAVLGSRPTP